MHQVDEEPFGGRARGEGGGGPWRVGREANDQLLDEREVGGGEARVGEGLGHVGAVAAQQQVDQVERHPFVLKRRVVHLGHVREGTVSEVVEEPGELAAQDVVVVDEVGAVARLQVLGDAPGQVAFAAA